MRTVARIESDFDPKQRTGSYFGLFQLSEDEFARYGSGDILDARDNAVAAAYKFATEDILFELNTHKKATFGDLYLIHQQGTQGAEEHINHPDRIAWKSMCATEEGKEKGDKWCKRAIWENTLPEIKRVWKSVDNLTSGVFLNMWQDQVDHFYAHYGTATKLRGKSHGPRCLMPHRHRGPRRRRRNRVTTSGGPRGCDDPLLLKHFLIEPPRRRT